MPNPENVHHHEIDKFGSLAERWWDKQGEFRTLHDINPLRLEFIKRHLNLPEQTMLDVGCGGGILSEALAEQGANVTGIDLSEELLDIADLHSIETGVSLNYEKISAEALTERQPESFDHVTCMEMLEHVPDPVSIVKSCSQLVKPGGFVFFSTLNRKPKSYLLAILAAEYLLKLVPTGTHDYKSFIKPSELSKWARNASLEIRSMIGIQYNPFTQQFSLGQDVDVNYIAAFQKQK